MHLNDEIRAAANSLTTANCGPVLKSRCTVLWEGSLPGLAQDGGFLSSLDRIARWLVWLVSHHLIHMQPCWSVQAAATATTTTTVKTPVSEPSEMNDHEEAQLI